MQVIGDVKDKDIVLVDDIIDSGGTITTASNLMMEQGARSVRAVCTHAVFSNNAIAKLENSSLKEVIVSDTIPQPGSEKITVLSTAGIFADVIDRIHNFESISDHFQFTTIL
jgi:ribose-phosphate pyrophosphokinase